MLFLTNREGAKSAKEEEEEKLRGENDALDISRDLNQSITQLSSFFFLRVLCVFAVHSFLIRTVVRILLALFLFFLTNREDAKSAFGEAVPEG